MNPNYVAQQNNMNINSQPQMQPMAAQVPQMQPAQRESGLKMVSYAWKQAFICMLILCIGLIIGVVVAIIIAVNLNMNLSKTENDLNTKNDEISGVYSAIGASDSASAVAMISNNDLLSGGDLLAIDTQISKKFSNYKLDFDDTTINFIVQRGAYKIASFGIASTTGTKRIILYSKIADGQWHLTDFDATAESPCINMSNDEKEIIKSLSVCVDSSENDADIK